MDSTLRKIVEIMRDSSWQAREIPATIQDIHPILVTPDDSNQSHLKPLVHANPEELSLPSPAPSTAPATKKRFIIPGLRWWIIVLLFGAAVLNYVDRQRLSALAPTIQADLKMDDREYADIVNLFLAAYTIVYLIAIAASWVIDDPALKSRMREIAVSHADAVFGRNPRLAAAPHQPQLGFTGIERGWPMGYKPDVCARLELTRGSISSAPGSEMFPFNPDGPYRHAEGWVKYGAAWCLSLAYLEFDRRAGTAP